MKIPHTRTLSFIYRTIKYTNIRYKEKKIHIFCVVLGKIFSGSIKNRDFCTLFSAQPHPIFSFYHKRAEDIARKRRITCEKYETSLSLPVFTSI